MKLTVHLVIGKLIDCTATGGYAWRIVALLACVMGAVAGNAKLFS